MKAGVNIIVSTYKFSYSCNGPLLYSNTGIMEVYTGHAKYISALMAKKMLADKNDGMFNCYKSNSQL